MPVTSPKHQDNARFYSVERRMGRMSDDRGYDRQRFENYSAWIDNQTRAMQKSEAFFFGRQSSKPLYGFEAKRPVIDKPRDVKTFYVQEPTFTSQTVCARKYDQNYKVVEDPLEDLRADPYHEPNFLAVGEKDHYGDQRSGSQHPEKNRLPKLWRPMDKELRKAVPQELVDSWMRSMGGDSRRVDPKDPTFQVLFKNDIDVVKNSSAKGIKELNLDSSVFHLPHYLEEEKKDLPPPPEPPVIGEDSLLPIEKTGRVFKNREEARVLVRPDTRFEGELDQLEQPPLPESPKSQMSPRNIGRKFGDSPVPSAATGAAAAMMDELLGRSPDGIAKPYTRPVQGIVQPDKSLMNLSMEERLGEWKALKKQDARGKIRGDVKEILKQSSILLKVQQHPPVVPRKIFVSAEDRYNNNWDRDMHRVRMRYPGGTRATEGMAGTWAPEGGGIAALAPPVNMSVASAVYRGGK